MAWVSTRFSNHAGPASLYARKPLQHDMLGLYFAVGNANHLPPWGGMDMLLSTNPIAAAIPAGAEPPIVLDMATTVAAYGKVKAKAKRGEQMPEGWMIDRQGKPLTDPTRADEGFLLPIGGHKGYGLALIVGLLAGTLNGAAMGRQVIDFNKDEHSTTNTGQAIVAIDPAAVGLAGGLGHLLAQAVEAAELGGPRLVGIDHHVVAVGIGRPEAHHAARVEPLLVDDLLQHRLAVGVEAGRGLAHHVILDVDNADGGHGRLRGHGRVAGASALPQLFRTWQK